MRASSSCAKWFAGRVSSKVLVLLLAALCYKGPQGLRTLAYQSQQAYEAVKVLWAIPEEDYRAFLESFKVFEKDTTEFYDNSTEDFALVRSYYKVLNRLCTLGNVEKMYIPPIMDAAKGVFENQMLFEAAFADELAIGPGKKALEIGCGRGRITHHVASHTGANVIGMNIDPMQIQIANAYANETGLAERLTFVEGNMNDWLPFPSESFDAFYEVQAMTYAQDLKVHQLPWRSSCDSNGQTPGEIALMRAQRGVDGARECLALIEGEVEEQRALEQVGLAEGVLVLLFQAEGGGDPSSDERHRIALPSNQVTWGQLVEASHAALEIVERMDARGGLRVNVLVFQVVVTDADEDDIRSFLHLWRAASSLGFSPKCSFEATEAPAAVTDAVLQLLSSPEPPRWRRLYIFGPMRRGADEIIDASIQSRLAHGLRRLSHILAERPGLQLWRVDRPSAMLMADVDRQLPLMLDRALGVKHCVHNLRERQALYRFFWGPLVYVEQRLLDKMLLLNEGGIVHPQQAVVGSAVAYMVSLADLWVRAVCGTDLTSQHRPDNLIRSLGLTESEHSMVLKEIDSALVAALAMSHTFPTLRDLLAEALPMRMLPCLPATTSILESEQPATRALAVLEDPSWQWTRAHKGKGRGKGRAEGSGKAEGKGKHAGYKPHAVSSGQRYTSDWRADR